MKRIAIVFAGMLFSAGVVLADQEIALQQQKLMRGQAKSLHGVIGKMVKGDIPYDQAAVDAAIADLEQSVAKIATVFTPNPMEDVKDSTFGSSQKIWTNKADFDAKIPPVAQAIADAKGKIKDAESLKLAFSSINDRCVGCHEVYRVKLK